MKVLLLLLFLGLKLLHKMKQLLHNSSKSTIKLNYDSNTTHSHLRVNPVVRQMLTSIMWKITQLLREGCVLSYFGRECLVFI